MNGTLTSRFGSGLKKALYRTFLCGALIASTPSVATGQLIPDKIPRSSPHLLLPGTIKNMTIDKQGTFEYHEFTNNMDRFVRYRSNTMEVTIVPVSDTVLSKVTINDLDKDGRVDAISFTRKQANEHEIISESSMLYRDSALAGYRKVGLERMVDLGIFLEDSIRIYEKLYRIQNVSIKKGELGIATDDNEFYPSDKKELKDIFAMADSIYAGFKSMENESISRLQGLEGMTIRYSHEIDFLPSIAPNGFDHYEHSRLPNIFEEDSPGTLHKGIIKI